MDSPAHSWGGRPPTGVVVMEEAEEAEEAAEAAEAGWRDSLLAAC